MELILKRIGPSDEQSLADLFQRNDRVEVTRGFDPFPLTAATARSIATRPTLDRYYLAMLNGAAAGFSMLRGWEEGYSVPSFGIFVDFGYHGQGLGSLLLAQTLEEARRAGCKKVRLSVFAGNPAALAVYQKAGFVEIERMDVEHGGRPDQKIIMLKDL